MAHQTKIINIWSFGLDADLVNKTREYLGRSYSLRPWATGIVPTLTDIEDAMPRLAIVSPDGYRAIKALPLDRIRHLDLIPKIMLLKEEYSTADLEYAIDSDVAEIIRPPYARKLFLHKLHRALETEAVHIDVLHMSREIELERELLEHKNDTLNFIISFLTGTASSLDPDSIIRAACTGFQNLFPVRSINVALWDNHATTRQLEIYTIGAESTAPEQRWREMLYADALSSGQCDDMQIKHHQLAVGSTSDYWGNATPEDGHVIRLPITLANEQLGVILLLTDMAKSLSREQAVVLNSALQHLALTLKNARNYQTVKQFADYDALTGVHSRRHFDDRLREEIERANRYKQPLSVIFADIDHFKRVNDTYGHRAGDQVLQQTSEIIRNTVRGSDYAARYGGEEFVILLPHTNLRKAMLMAERLRKNVEKHIFTTEAGDVNLTMSLGVSGVTASSQTTCSLLIQEADSALYAAKDGGRNMALEYENCHTKEKLAI